MGEEPFFHDYEASSRRRGRGKGDRSNEVGIYGGGGGGSGAQQNKNKNNSRWNRREKERGGAAHLAHIHGTEEDKVNCSFFHKVGGCQHGNLCRKKHTRPAFSRTIILRNMYLSELGKIRKKIIQERADKAGDDLSHPDIATKYDKEIIDYEKLGIVIPSEEEIQDDFEDFYEALYEILAKFGEIDELQVCDNLCNHLAGNIYVKFFQEEDAEDALKALEGRWYDGRVILGEYANEHPQSARCHDYENDGSCRWGNMCNYVHQRKPNPILVKDLKKKYGPQRDLSPPSRRNKERHYSPSRSRDRSTRRRERDRSDRSEERHSRGQRDRERNGRSRTMYDPETNERIRESNKTRPSQEDSKNDTEIQNLADDRKSNKEGELDNQQKNAKGENMNTLLPVVPETENMDEINEKEEAHKEESKEQ